ncbi:MAG TPA: ABC transporter permease [Treponema sp.]|nr:ABC transporter permease [Treponema sp.]HAC31737.1 ABC transporter permease [Treponema sp.]
MVKKLGAYVLSEFNSVPYVLGFIGKTFRESFAFLRTKSSRKILIMQLLFTFIEALPLIAVISTAIGTAIYILGDKFLSSIGQSQLIYNLLSIVVTLELGPVIVAFIVTARSATAIATEIGGMVTSHQIESYISCGVDPISHLVSPRFLGVTMSVFFLNLYFSFCGLLGPAVIQFIINPANVVNFVQGVLSSITVKVLFTSILKSLLFGMIISICATYYGFSVERSSTEIPVVGISAVGKSVLGIILVDVFIIVLFYL